MKTIKQWFERVADPKLREELLANMTQSQLLASSLKRAVNNGFDGGYFRSEQLSEMAANNQIELIPDKPKIKKSDLLKRIEELERVVHDKKDKKIVFDYELTDKGKTITTFAVPDQETVKEVCRISIYKYIFKQWDKATSIFYIGHYA